MAKTTALLDAPIDERPEVRELRTKLSEAEAELRASEEELSRLSSILNPPSTSATCTPDHNEVTILRARQQIPVARENFLLAKATVLELKPRYERARAEAVQALTAERNRSRLEILKRFASALEDARDIGDELLAFDLHTVKLGGSNPGHPFGELLDSPPYRVGLASAVRQYVERLELIQ